MLLVSERQGLSSIENSSRDRHGKEVGANKRTQSRVVRESDTMRRLVPLPAGQVASNSDISGQWARRVPRSVLKENIYVNAVDSDVVSRRRVCGPVELSRRRSRSAIDSGARSHAIPERGVRDSEQRHGANIDMELRVVTNRSGAQCRDGEREIMRVKDVSCAHDVPRRR